MRARSSMLAIASCCWIIAGSGTALAQQPAGDDLRIEAREKANPWTHLNVNNKSANFQFVVIPDRTGGARSGVFADAVEKINLLQPEFVVSVGDLIEGYNERHMTYRRQWDEFDALVGKLDMPFFYAGGNHDLSNDGMLAEWTERYGPTYYHFVYGNVLFMVLNSEDPPDPPPGAHRTSVSPQQVEYFRDLLRDHPDVRWTFVFCHRPMWMKRHANSGFAEIEAMLADRPYTVFAGHVHRYSHEKRKGREYYVLATAGGVSQVRGPFVGEFDHVTWVTMADDRPVVANILLDGIGDHDIRKRAFKDFCRRAAAQNQIIKRDSILIDSDRFTGAAVSLPFVNNTDLLQQVRCEFKPMPPLVASPTSFEIALGPRQRRLVRVQVEAPTPLLLDDVPLITIAGTASYEVSGDPSFSFEVPFSQRIAVDRVFQSRRWDFVETPEGWGSASQCSLSVKSGVLEARSEGSDPYFHTRLDILVPVGDTIEVKMRARSGSAGSGSFYWGTDAAPAFSASRMEVFRMRPDGQWHEYTVSIHVAGRLTSLRLDPSTVPGLVEVDWIEVSRRSE